MVENENRVIKVIEVVQAGDIFLMHFRCPMCADLRFDCHPPSECKTCRLNLSEYGFLLPSTRSGYRLLAGTKRKTGLRYHKKTIATLLEIQNRCCAYCDQALEEYQIEHIRPLSVGGTNNFNNLVLSCKICNLIAGDRVFQDFYAKKTYVVQLRKNRP